MDRGGGSHKIVRMSQTCQIRVLALGSAAEACGWASTEIQIDDGATLAALIDRLAAECPRIGEARRLLRFAVNQTYADERTTLKNGDEVAIIPPVSGGAVPAARLVREPIDVPALVREVESPNVGAIATFVGVVRYETGSDSKALKALEYTAYDAMALSEMSKLCEAVAAERSLHKVLMVHRLGTMKVGDTSVAVIASAPHREGAFDACRTLIDQLKQSVPIFKTEIWQDGSRTWVNGV